MTKINRHIEIAHTNVAPYSSMGMKSCVMIQGVLSQYYSRVGISIVNDMEGLEAMVASEPDLVFLGMKRLPNQVHSENPKDIWMSEILDSKGINYTGSKRLAIELDFDKEAAKIRVHQAGLPTADFFTSFPGQYKSGHELPLKFPMFIKPLDAGGGKGIGNDSVVHTFLEFERKVQSIYSQLGSRSIIESYLTGREFSVAILGDDASMLVMPIELLADETEDGHKILGAKIKDDDTERVIAITNQKINKMVGSLARDIYTALGARDLGRIDIRMDSTGAAYFLEANLVPGLADNDFVSYFNRACLINENMNYEKMILHITKLGLSRSVPLATT